jgi:hypothetical protein
MKKHSMLWLLLGLISVTKGQITISKSSMPAAGDTIRFSTALPTDLPSGWMKKGASQTWDFSKIEAQNSELREYQSASKTPYAFYFFGQTGLKTADTIGGGPITFTNVFSFYSASNAVFKAEGLGYSYSGIPLASMYEDEDEIYQFPLQYNDSDVSTYKFTFAIPGQQLFSFKQAGKRTNVVDAWGSIKTPYKEYTDVIRVKTFVDGTDTIETQFFKQGFPRKQIIYQWLATSEKIPVMEVSGQLSVTNQFVPNQVRFRDKYNGLSGGGFNPLGVEEFTSKAIAVHPNPSSDKITVSCLVPTLVPFVAPEELPVFNSVGQSFILKRLPMTENNYNTYSIEQLPSGMYWMQIWGGALRFAKD